MFYDRVDGSCFQMADLMVDAFRKYTPMQVSLHRERERERERERGACVCVCVCVRERERERER